MYIYESCVSMDYNRSSHYPYSCKYHIIFCPKYRKKALVNGVDEDLKKIILDLQKDMYKVIEMEVMPDYVHLLLDCNPYKSLVDIVKHIKHQSALILKKKYPVELDQKMPCFWTRSVFISSVGTISMETVQAYIRSQKKNSRKEK